MPSAKAALRQRTHERRQNLAPSLLPTVSWCRSSNEQAKAPRAPAYVYTVPRRFLRAQAQNPRTRFPWKS